MNFELPFSFPAGTYLDVGASTGGNGTLIVDNASVGAGPTLASTWGKDGATATVTFSNKAKGLLAGRVFVVGNDIAGTTATVTVEGGSEVTFGDLDINVVGGATAGTFTVTGEGPAIHCELRIADCGLNNNEPAAGHASVAVNPQSAIRNPQFQILKRPPPGRGPAATRPHARTVRRVARSTSTETSWWTEERSTSPSWAR